MSIIEKFNILKKWCIDNNSYVNDKITITGNNDNRYIVSNGEILSNETIIEIHKNVCLTGELINELINIIPDLENIKDELEDKHKLLLVLIYQHSIQEKSFFYPYLNILPSLEDFNQHPYILTRELLKNNIDSNIKQIIEPAIHFYNLINNDIDKFTDLISKIDFFNNKNIFSREIIIWGTLIIHTRAWAFNGNYILVPIMDLMQHSNESKIINRLINNRYIMNSDVYYGYGDTIYDTYGTKTQIELYLIYGFQNQGDKIFKINLAIPEHIKNNHHTKDIKGEFYLLSSGVQKQLLQFVRICNMDDKEINEFFEKHNYDYLAEMYSLDNEVKAIRNFLNICHQLKNDNSNNFKIADDNFESNNLLIKNMSEIFLLYESTIKCTVLNLLNQWNGLLKQPFTFSIELIFDKNQN
jgi:hypothetical protein